MSKIPCIETCFMKTARKNQGNGSAALSGRVPRVMVVDDDRFYQETIWQSVALAMSSMTIVFFSTVSDSKARINSVHDPYDLAIIDLHFEGGNGIDVVRCLSKEYPQTISIVLSVASDEESVFRSVRAGADGFVVKGDALLPLPKAIEYALNGFHPISPSVLGYFLRVVGRDSHYDSEDLKPVLTLRELQLLREFASGKSYKEAAESMEITIFTVRAHTSNIYRKMGVKSNLAALSLARRYGLV